jgi:hypothetical protein
MLPDEYQKRRSLPRHLQPPGEPPAVFSYEIRDATEDDVPDILALYRHYVRNSVVTLDEKAPSITAFRLGFDTCRNSATRSGLPCPRRGHSWDTPMSSPFEKKPGFERPWRVPSIWGQPRSVEDSAALFWVT